MNWNTIEGRWKELKGNIKEQWGELTDDEIDQAEGKRDILLGKLQAKYGIAKEEAEKQLDSWAEKLNLD
ncbi:MAG: CsbD family protein [Pseudomonadota bacterium]|nr:CsbD family protein [Pseudomonadota bacterium]